MKIEIRKKKKIGERLRFQHSLHQGIIGYNCTLPPRGSLLSGDLKTNSPVGWSMHPKVAAEVNKLD